MNASIDIDKAEATNRERRDQEQGIFETIPTLTNQQVQTVWYFTELVSILHLAAEDGDRSKSEGASCNRSKLITNFIALCAILTDGELCVIEDVISTLKTLADIAGAAENRSEVN